MSDTTKPISGADLRKDIHDFQKIDAESVEQFNSIQSWKGGSIERTLDFLSWRLLHTKDFLAHLANVLAEHMEAKSETPLEG